MKRFWVILVIIAAAPSVWADVIHLKNGGTLEGVVLKSDRDGMIVLLKYATVTILSSEVESIEKSAPGAAAKGPRIADWKACFQALAARPWGQDLHLLPAPIIEGGDLKNVPYVLHACDDYEFALFGDPDAPARVELGISGALLTREQARRECVDLVASFLRDAEDVTVFRSLDFKLEKRERDGLSFQIDQEPDSRGRETWWVSVSDGRALDAARVSEKQLASLAVSDPPPQAPRNPTLVEKPRAKGEPQEVITPFGTEPHNPKRKRTRAFGGGHWGGHIRWHNGHAVMGPMR